ncbi:MAG: hypothetical protein WCW64_00495 [Phycisphaerae bacterium]|jgi:hypothetical protein
MEEVKKMIDRKKVIEEMSKIAASPNEDGIIDGFNVLVNQLPSDFWNEFNERISTKVKPDLRKQAEYLLYNCARECGYNTGYGIITSKEWKAIVGPMVGNTEDVLYGAFAVFTAWGWAKSEIVHLEPGKKMIVKAYDYYESDVVKHGISPKLSAYMIAGVCAAFMDLAYGGDYPKGFNKFKCEQVRGIECGDEYGEFVVTPI